MSEDQAVSADDGEWRPCRITFPRRGLFMDGYRVRRRWIMPGRYLIRRSRTLDETLYRTDDG